MTVRTRHNFRPLGHLDLISRLLRYSPEQRVGGAPRIGGSRTSTFQRSLLLTASLRVYHPIINTTYPGCSRSSDTPAGLDYPPNPCAVARPHPTPAQSSVANQRSKTSKSERRSPHYPMSGSGTIQALRVSLRSIAAQRKPNCVRPTMSTKTPGCTIFRGSSLGSGCPFERHGP